MGRLWWEPLGKQCQYLLFENGFSPVFRTCNGNLDSILSISSVWKLDLCFVWACDGNLSRLWKIVSISSIWKTRFPVFFLGVWWKLLGNNVTILHLETGFPLLFGRVMGTSGKECQYLLFEILISFFFLACDATVWKNNVNILFLNFLLFFWPVMGTSGKIVSKSFLWNPDFCGFFRACDGNFREHNGHVFCLKPGWISVIFGACDGNFWENTANLF